VGSALVAEIERIARQHGLTYLELLSSLTAEPFYRALAYDVEDRVEHAVSSGGRIGGAEDAEDHQPVNDA
jgi:putative acetyltransferase